MKYYEVPTLLYINYNRSDYFSHSKKHKQFISEKWNIFLKLIRQSKIKYIF